ncbi:MAG TPA: hypothetical protein PKH31_02855 [Candidatus Sumerlaeota bacterium]|nr:hypothetical protein [Candidatus Sumerlaeota bacterium]
MKRFLNTLILSAALSAVAFAPGYAVTQEEPPVSPNGGPEQMAVDPQQGDNGQAGAPESGVAVGSRNAAGGRRERGSAYGGQVGEARVEVDSQTGSLIVITDDETNERIKRVIESLDEPVQQVLIKVLFLEITHNDDLDLGAEFTLTKQKTASDGTVDMKKVYSSLFGVSSLTNGAKFALLDDDLEMTIRALAETGKLEVLSRPSIMAKNNEAAIITVGNEVPRITNSRVTQDAQTINTVEYTDIGIILDVTPRISPDGKRVEMTLAPEISTMTGKTVKISDTIDAPVYAKRSAETCVVVPNGKTVVIGGLMENQETETTQKVPVLGDIWLLGSLFKRSVKTKAKTELLIFLTPEVVATDSSMQAMTDREYSESDVARRAVPPQALHRYIKGVDEKTGQEAGDASNSEAGSQPAEPKALEPIVIGKMKKKTEPASEGQPPAAPAPQETPQKSGEAPLAEKK